MNRQLLPHLVMIGGILLALVFDLSLALIEHTVPLIDLRGPRNVVGALGMICSIIEIWRVWTAILIEGSVERVISKSKIFLKLRRQLQDAGFGVNRMWLLALPKVELTFSDNQLTGILKIQNSVKFNKRLDDIDFSAALENYKIERHYISRDANWYVYELLRADVSFRMHLTCLSSFVNVARQIAPYDVFLDMRSICQLQHTLLVGQTGSGKTYALYSLILQMLCKRVPYELYFADPKGSSISVLSQQIAPDRTAVSFEEIVDLLENFVAAMDERKAAFAD